MHFHFKNMKYKLYTADDLRGRCSEAVLSPSLMKDETLTIENG